jgi:hypothetical protein
MKATIFKSYFQRSRSRYRPWSAGNVISAGEQLAEFINKHSVRVVQVVHGDDEITLLYESTVGTVECDLCDNLKGYTCEMCFTASLFRKRFG